MSSAGHTGFWDLQGLRVLVGARRDSRVQAKRIRRFWLLLFLNPNAILPTMEPSLRGVAAMELTILL